jgi:CRP/FNR family transcriptional regulator
MTPGQENIVRMSHLFADLTDEEWKKLRSIISTQRAARGETIFSEGEAAHGFYMVLEGKVKILKLSAEGKEQILQIFSQSEHFAEAPVFSGKRFPAWAVALTDCVLAYFPAGDFRALLSESTSIALNMLGALSRYMHHLVAVVEELSLKEVPARLARFLLDNAGPPGATPGPREYRLATTKGDLALRLGTTSETFSRVFGRMKKLDIVSEKNRRILLHREDVLRDMVHGMKL